MMQVRGYELEDQMDLCKRNNKVRKEVNMSSPRLRETFAEEYRIFDAKKTDNCRMTCIFGFNI